MTHEERENERLREALRRIADDPKVRSHPDSVAIARAALAADGCTASARHARVISGTGDSGERLELAALVRGLRAND